MTLEALSDGVVTLRPPGPGDARLLIAGRDAEFFRWIGPGAEVPDPVACVWVDDELVGWLDYDVDHDWLKPGEVNVGYYLFPAARGCGYASRAMGLFMTHLASTEHTVATLRVAPDNARSVALAGRTGFVQTGEVDGDLFFAQAIRSNG